MQLNYKTILCSRGNAVEADALISPNLSPMTTTLLIGSSEAKLRLRVGLSVCNRRIVECKYLVRSRVLPPLIFYTPAVCILPAQGTTRASGSAIYECMVINMWQTRLLADVKQMDSLFSHFFHYPSTLKRGPGLRELISSNQGNTGDRNNAI